MNFTAIRWISYPHLILLESYALNNISSRFNKNIKKLPFCQNDGMNKPSGSEHSYNALYSNEI